MIGFMKKRIKLFYCLLLIMIWGLCIGCGKVKNTPKEQSTNKNEAESSNFYENRTVPKYLSRVKGIEKLDKKVDYSNMEHWLEIPQNPDKPVDVIYLYPTVYGSTLESSDDIADIDDASMRVLAIYAAASQASVFEENCNIYAPYYRQFTVNSLLDVIEHSPESLSYIASKDLYPMLDYYFENCNEGRPFILAGHSQGSVWLTVILEDYMKEHPEYLENMVAAYVIGYSVTKEYLAANPHLKFAKGADDTGVIISYNTEGSGNKDAYNCVVKENAISINPINWKLDSTYASVEENLGSLGSDGEILDHYADAKVDTQRGVVICDSVKNSKEMQMDLKGYFGADSFHLQDYNLYYKNLEKNVADRIQAFESRSLQKD